MRKRFNLLIKFGIGIAFVAAIAYQLLHEKDTELLWNSFLERWSESDSWTVVVAICMMPLCWLLEARKWIVLMKPALRLTPRESLRAVLGGVAVSLFTPNRIGEYGGRILFVPPQYNWRAVVATLVGSFGQNLVQITIGLVAVICFLLFMPEVPHAFRTGLTVLIAAIVILSSIIYFKLPELSAWLQRFSPPRWLRKPWTALRYLQRISPVDLSLALGYSLLKYLVFSTQFVLFLYYFGVEVPLPWIFAGVAVMYLMQTSIPLPPFVDVVVRSELAVLLWAPFAVNELSVFAASFFIWIINLLIPAFFGMIAISTVNVLQSLGYENEVSKSDTSGSDDYAADRVA